MRKFYLLLLATFLCTFVFGQTPGVQWSRPLGGTRGESGRDIQTTPDGGFLLFGTTSSNDVDVSGNHSDSSDLWVVKMDNLGKVQWQKCFGGTSHEIASKLFCNPDGSAVLFGTTSSNNGDVEGARGSYDLWVLKIDESGNILWKRTFGGSGYEGFVDVKLTNDNGYIIAANTQSNNNGDITGSHGGQEIWLVKLSSSGVLEWQKTLGGSMDEYVQSIVQNVDGNYVLTGFTWSNNGDFTGSHGVTDICVAKLTSSGNVVWAKTYGGTSGDSGYDLVIANDGSIAVLGHTSSVNGDVTGKTTSDRDLWVLNLDYNNGNLNWQKIMGGSGIENPIHIIQDADGMFLASGHTGSTNGHAITNHGKTDVFLARLESNGNLIWTKCFGGPSSENMNDFLNDVAAKSYVFISSTYKEGGDVIGYHQNANSLELEDAWFVKVDYDGNLEWQRCLGGTISDNLYSVKKLSKTSYILTGVSSSDDGDLYLNRGIGDAWVVQIGPINTIKGTVFIDKNSNGSKDADEPYYSGVTLKSKKTIDSVGSVPYNGLFNHDVDTGTYVTTISSDLPYYNIVPSSFSSTFSSYFNADSISFALQPIPNKKDLSISLFPTTPARPGFKVSYNISYTNVGTEAIPNGQVLFKKDSRLSFVSASPNYASISGDTLKWDYSNLKPSDTASIALQFQIAAPTAPQPVNIGDTLVSLAIINPIAGDLTPKDDTAIVKHVTQGSYDPNDKYENNGGVVTPEIIANEEYFNYTIRFQNTGTDTAFTVVVRDTLDNRLNWSTLQMVNSSHAYNLSIDEDNKLTWTFNDINLPDSNINEPKSHGYIAYRIKPKNTVPLNDTIHNLASIYFDYNLPVRTNNAFAVVKSSLMVLPISLLSFSGVYNKDQASLRWSTANEHNLDRFEVERSTTGIQFGKVGTLTFKKVGDDYEWFDHLAGVAGEKFYYRLKMIDKDGKVEYSQIIVLYRGKEKENFSIYPNPAASTHAILLFQSTGSHDAEIKVVDANGRRVLRQSAKLVAGNNSILLNGISGLAASTYFIQVSYQGKTFTKTLIIQN